MIPEDTAAIVAEAKSALAPEAAELLDEYVAALHKPRPAHVIAFLAGAVYYYRFNSSLAFLRERRGGKRMWTPKAPMPDPITDDWVKDGRVE